MFNKLLVRTLLLFFVFIEPNFAQDTVKKISDNLNARVDKFTENKTIEIKEIEVNGLTIGGFSSGNFIFIPIGGGNFFTTEPHIMMNITSSTSKWKFLDSHRLYILLDGKRDDEITKIADEMEYSNSVLDSSVFEHMTLTFRGIDEFKKIAFAKTVETRLGGQEFSIDYEKRKGWRELFNYLDNIKQKTKAEAEKKEGAK
jgi:hypothetical protein